MRQCTPVSLQNPYRSPSEAWPFIKKNGETRTAIDEISALAGMARLHKQISTHQEQIIKSASRLTRMRVRDVMIPVEQVSFLSTSQTLPEALVTAHTDAHTTDQFDQMRLGVLTARRGWLTADQCITAWSKARLHKWLSPKKGS